MIHKRFDFSQLGGFPLTQERLQFMQEAYSGIDSNMVKIIGNNVIISGVVITDLKIGYNVSDGWIIYNNELLPFIGGNGLTLKFNIVSTSTPLLFQDGVQRTVQFSKSASLVSIGSINISDLSRLSVTMSDISAAVQDRTEGRLHNSLFDIRYHKEYGNYVRVDGVLSCNAGVLNGGNSDLITIEDFPFRIDGDWREAFQFETYLHISQYSESGPIVGTCTIAECFLEIRPEVSSPEGSIVFNIVSPNLEGWFTNPAVPGDFRVICYVHLALKIRQV